MEANYTEAEVKGYLSTIDDRLDFLAKKHEKFPYWTYNKLAAEWTEEFEGGPVNKERLIRTQSMESVFRIYRLHYKDKNGILPVYYSNLLRQ